mmetsp:Transcript_118892/g.332938  ORF Transcript_118892/g.332938 Transcript_118892/m.332938 type:complete len:324 (+) Transcript_118892:417-1388(+)
MYELCAARARGRPRVDRAVDPKDLSRDVEGHTRSSLGRHPAPRCQARQLSVHRHRGHRQAVRFRPGHPVHAVALERGPRERRHRRQRHRAIHGAGDVAGIGLRRQGGCVVVRRADVRFAARGVPLPTGQADGAVHEGRDPCRHAAAELPAEPDARRARDLGGRLAARARPPQQGSGAPTQRRGCLARRVLLQGAGSRAGSLFIAPRVARSQAFRRLRHPQRQQVQRHGHPDSGAARKGHARHRAQAPSRQELGRRGRRGVHRRRPSTGSDALLGRRQQPVVVSASDCWTGGDAPKARRMDFERLSRSSRMVGDTRGSCDSTTI